MKTLKESEVKVVKRSQIAFNPRNPKRHTDESIKRQLKNFKSIGILGGLVLNMTDGKLISGHKRIQALDLYYKYDGTPETDYEVRVEAVELDEKSATEQLTFMSGITDTRPDYNLIAPYVSEIDPAAAGLDEAEYGKLMALAGDREMKVDVVDASDAFFSPKTDLKDDMKTSEEIVQEHKEKPKMTAEQVKAEKANNDRIATTRQDTQDLYVFLSFKDIEEKAAFCELLGYAPTNSMMIPGEDVMRLIE